MSNPEFPLISVIIPAYNHGVYLRQAVESIFAQSYKPLQVIVVNDGSTDTTAEVMEQLQKEYPALEYLEQKNSGVCLACNQALKKVIGQYLIRLDADDYLPADYCQILMTEMQKNTSSQIGYIYCDAEYCGDREGRMAAQEFSGNRLVQENYIHVSALVRTELARQVGYYNPNMQYGFEDWDFWLSLYEKGIIGTYCRETFLYYRQKKAGSRNQMQAEQHRLTRKQIYLNHPKLYANPLNKAWVLGWKIKRRLQRYLGKEGK